MWYTGVNPILFASPHARPMRRACSQVKNPLLESKKSKKGPRLVPLFVTLVLQVFFNGWNKGTRMNLYPWYAKGSATTPRWFICLIPLASHERPMGRGAYVGRFRSNQNRCDRPSNKG